MKKPQIIVSLEQARILALKGQGLLSPACKKRGKNATLAVVEHLGYVQIDTLAVIARAHHHTLWSRLPDYSEDHLKTLMEKDKDIFEYWGHAASYLPMSDFRYSLPAKKDYADGKSHWFTQDKKIKKYVLDRIECEGALQSKDFEHKRVGPGNWFEWKPAKRALEQLFMEGKLMVARRQGFQKVYDLTERVLPVAVDTSLPSENEVAEHLVRKAINSNGIVDEKEIYHIRRGLKASVNRVLEKLLKEEEILKVGIEGIEGTYFFTTEKKIRESKKKNEEIDVHLLSPFDNAIIQRKRVLRLFDFDYSIECYVPEDKRKFGYFCLPVLYGERFVARLDPKADRKTKVFHIKVMYFEGGFVPDDLFNILFAKKLKEFAIFNGCEKIIINTADKKWKKVMNDLVSGKLG